MDRVEGKAGAFRTARFGERTASVQSQNETQSTICSVLLVNPHPRRFATGWLLYPVWIAGLLGLRVTQVLSEQHLFYDQEFTNMGRLALAVTDGTVQWTPVGPFVSEYMYGFFAPGTLVIQFLTLLLSVPLGPNGFALIGAGVVCEVLLLVTWIRCGRSMMSPWLVSLSVLPLLFAPWPAVQWQLMPFGNHTEFLWIPLVALLFFANASPRRWWHWALLALLVLAGLYLYRLTVASALGCVLAGWLALPRRWRIGTALAAAALVVVSAAGVFGRGWLLGFDAEVHRLDPGLLRPDRLLVILWDNVPQLAHSCWGNRCQQFVAPAGWNVVYKAILMLLPVFAAVAGWLDPRSRPAVVYALGWCAAGLCIPALFDSSSGRYFVGLYYALLACGLVALGVARGKARIAVALCFAVLAVGGMDAARRHHRPELWADNRRLDALGVGQRLGVRSIELDAVPFYNRMLDEKRYNVFVGALPDPPPAHVGICAPEHDLGHPVASIREGSRQRGMDLEEAFRAAGRGAWIRADQDLTLLSAFWTCAGVSEPYLSWLRDGALAEARLYGRAASAPEATLEEPGAGPTQ